MPFMCALAPEVSPPSPDKAPTLQDPPQRLKPLLRKSGTAWLKPCPDADKTRLCNRLFAITGFEVRLREASRSLGTGLGRSRCGSGGFFRAVLCGGWSGGGGAGQQFGHQETGDELLDAVDIEVYGGAIRIRCSDDTEAVLFMLQILRLPKNLHKTSLTDRNMHRAMPGFFPHRHSATVGKSL